MRQVPTKPFSATGQSYVMSFGKTNTFIAIQPHYDAQTTPKLDLQDPGGWEGLLSAVYMRTDVALSSGRREGEKSNGIKFTPLVLAGHRVGYS